MSYNTKNYTEPGADRTVINGEIVLQNGGALTIDAETSGTMRVTGLDGATGILVIEDNGYLNIAALENQADSEATTVAGLKDDFNALLAKLQEAGIMAAEATD